MSNPYEAPQETGTPTGCNDKALSAFVAVVALAYGLWLTHGVNLAFRQAGEGFDQGEWLLASVVLFFGLWISVVSIVSLFIAVVAANEFLFGVKDQS